MNKKETTDSQKTTEPIKNNEVTSIVLPVFSDDGKSQKFVTLQTLDEAEKYLTLYEKHSGILEKKLNSEHKRDLENRQQTQIEEKDKADRELHSKLELERIELERDREKNREIDRQHQRGLEENQQKLNQITIYLSFSMALVGTILAFTISITAGGAIASAALAIPTSMKVFDVWRSRKEGEK
jgi:Flp pilus assembly protein TadB